MLIEKMHHLANSKVSKFILGLITLSFLVGGMSGYLFSSNDTYAAKVNGEVISQQDFLNRYNQEFEARAQREGEALWLSQILLNLLPHFVKAPSIE